MRADLGRWSDLGRRFCIFASRSPPEPADLPEVTGVKIGERAFGAAARPN